jgi:hypothetical protein
MTRIYYADRPCMEQHPRTGEGCVKQDDHNIPEKDAPTRQHITADGRLKWPTLHELDPAEGYNVAVPYRM